MSLILEALKKAERQHKLGDVPSISAQPVESKPSGMRGLGWLMLILLAGVMLGLGLYLGGMGRSELSHVESSQLPPVEATPPPEALAPVQQPMAARPVDPAPKAEASPPPQPVVQAPPPAPVPAPPARPLTEMPSGFVSSLPSLNIDIHSYDQRAAKRYVLINLNKYREGDYLAEGPQLIEILPDGVVLEHLGERFILPIGNQ
jgi:general secretion pathway protein B